MPNNLNSAQKSCTTSLLSTLEPLNSTLQRFWELEEVNIPKIQDPDDVRCEEIYKKTTTRGSSGRYIVPLPFKTETTPLITTRNSIQRQYIKFEKRLSSQAEIQVKYQDFMQEYIKLNHVART